MELNKPKSESRSPGAPPLKVLQDRNLHIIFAITLMAVMGVSSLTPAFPKIVEVLKITKQQSGLLITVFTLPGVLLTPILGILADRYGRKKILVPSLLLFSIAGFSCFFIRHFPTLLIMRFFQGMGAASLGSLNATLIGDIYAGPRLSEAMGYNSGILSIGTASYPAIGGLLATFGWNFPFILPILGLPVALLVLFTLKNPEPEHTQNFKDYLRSAAKTFQKKEVVAIFTVIFMTFIMIYGTVLNYFPFFIRASFGSSALVIGLVLSSMSISSALTSSRLGRLTPRYGQKKILISSCILYILSMLLLPFIPSIWLLPLPALLFGAANGLNMPTVQSLLASISPLQYRGVFMSVNGMVLRLGQTLGPITMMGIVAVSSGGNLIFWVSAIFAVNMLSIVMVLEIPNQGNGKNMTPQKIEEK